MSEQELPVDQIRVPAGRRRLDPDWVETLAWLIAEQGQKQAIEVIAESEGYRLVFGAHRLAAARQAGFATIRGMVKDAEAFANEFEVTLREITENLARRELSVLDRSVDIARWREVYEATNTIAGRGRPKKRTDADDEEKSRKFATLFSEVAQKTLGVRRDSIFRALRIARIPAAVRDRIALHAIADNQSELLLLAGEAPERQEQIAALLTGDPPKAATVGEAIALIDRTAPRSSAPRWQKLSTAFSRLKPSEQSRFFELHEAAITRWLSERGTR
ncbi:ParB N-terminal domain-containing protein [Nitratireductor mangrovi]|uniref:ParB N-terminal domain-containing protein n=1 Tax=Nitratireductor mangrovi TaxID=2599600 RepID=A0A5B8KU30_9HYPH|nr:ParB N-terminal domain-containing protein [Nitratireductor mangrovi]QDY99093.1 ParB N-terminal domain-containing protein [Nitratireductor mangrovi]